MVSPMPSTTPNPILNKELNALIANCGFLKLTSSDKAFPKCKGTGLPILHVSTSSCTAYIALQGAHLLSFQAKGGKPLLWISPNCDFTPGVALRGGIPVCLPWFGPNLLDPKKPKHGFARNSEWQLSNATRTAEGCAQLVFTFESPANELFNFNFSAQLTMTLGTMIKLDLKITNTDVRSFDCSWALHSYHPVSSLEEVRVLGLAGRTYLDNLDNHSPKIQHGDVNFVSEVDRVFPAIDNTVKISGSPGINIDHYNCPSVVVWNPGAANAAKITDIGAGNEQTYICVERGAVLSEKWNLAAGEARNAWIEIKET
jgi:glucose-6-phosphate 1-epimerase